MLGAALMTEDEPELVTWRRMVKTWPAGMPKRGAVNLVERLEAVSSCTTPEETWPEFTPRPEFASTPAALPVKDTLPTPAAE